MLKTERKIARTLAHLVAGGALMLVVGAAAIVPAQGQAPAPAPGQPQGPARGRGPGIQLPRQGFEATGQNPANYTPEEAAAVEVVKKWVETSTNHDLAAHMALIDDNIVFRPDPTSALRRGARAYCGAYGFVRSATSVLKIDELFVVGGPSETLAIIKRTDINSPADTGREGALNGYQVSLVVFARVKNGKITNGMTRR
jgi:ketosteroid isomerase-like protein